MIENFKKFAKQSNLKQYDFCIHCILRNSSINTAGVQELWKEAGMSGKASVSVVFAKAVGQLKKVFGISSIEEIPSGTAGRGINVSGLIRLLLKKNPELTASEAASILLPFQITFSSCLFGQVKGWGSSRKKSDAEGQGPRARGRGRRRGRGSSQQISHSSSNFSDLEDELDNLIMKCRDIGNSDVMEKLKDARRTLIKSS